MAVTDDEKKVWENHSKQGDVSMTLKLRPFPEQDAEPKVLVSNKSNADWILMEIREVGSHRYPAIPLRPNSSTPLSLSSGAYRFGFQYQRVSGGAEIEVTIETPSPNSPYTKAQSELTSDVAVTIVAADV